MCAFSTVFSIIVPVYNVEQYLPQCIDSILQQSFPYFELILINDGSTDKSGILCDEYALKDTRVRVFHKRNEGVSAARNVGIENAKGEWILFVDSDDWVDKEMLGYINTNITHRRNVNFIQFGFRKIAGSVIEYGNIPHGILEIPTQDYCKLHFYKPTCWGYAIKSDVIKKHGINFPAGIKYAEDHVFILKILMCTSFVAVLDKCFYNYRLRDGSAMNSPWSVSMAKDHLLAIEDLLYFTNNRNNVNIAPLLYASFRTLVIPYFGVSIRHIKNISDVKNIKKIYKTFLKKIYQADYCPFYFRFLDSYLFIILYYGYVKLKNTFKRDERDFRRYGMGRYKQTDQ